MNLIKATQPFERISLDFKGLLLSVSKKTCLLVIVDEFTRFPFAYTCSDMKAFPVIQKLTDLFCLFGFPNYVHRDQVLCRMSLSRGFVLWVFLPANRQDIIHGVTDRWSVVIVLFGKLCY